MEPVVNPESTIPSLSADNTHHTHTRSPLMIPLLSALALLFVVIIIWAVNITRSKTPEKSTIALPSVTPTQTVEKPAGKEYIDQNVKFRLTYPSDWIASDPYVGSYPEKTWVVDITPETGTGGLIQVVTRPGNSPDPTSEEWVLRSLTSDYQLVGNDTASFFVDNIQAMRYENAVGSIMTFFNTTDTLYLIALFKGSIHNGYQGSDSDYQDELAVYEELIKSFKVGTNPPVIPTMGSVIR